MSQTGIIFRNALLEDLPQVVRLVADIVVSKEPLQYASEVISDPPLEAYVKAFKEILLPPNEALVGVLDSVIVAYLQITYVPGLMRQGQKRCIVEDVRVSRSMRGSKIGRELMNQAVERAKKNDCWVIQLTTNKWRDDAIAFYENIGFRRTHEGFRIQF